MLKLMENDYVFHWHSVQESKARGWEEPRVYHEGACDLILKYYAMFLDITVRDAYKLLQCRIAEGYKSSRPL